MGDEKLGHAPELLRQGRRLDERQKLARGGSGGVERRTTRRRIGASFQLARRSGPPRYRAWLNMRFERADRFPCHLVERKVR